MHVLIVEDEPKLASLHQDYLQQSDYSTTVLTDGNSVVPWVKSHAPDLIVLDVMLPGKDGLSICREVRQFSDVPIIMVTARVEEIDRILGLELGADDYVCKPVSPKELVARVRANLRRVVSSASPKPKGNGLVIHESMYKAEVNGIDLGLTAIEFQLLLTLMKHPGRIFSRDQLMQSIYSDSRIVSDRTIDSHVKKIRKKIASHSPDLEYIHSLYGVGFKYQAP